MLQTTPPTEGSAQILPTAESIPRGPPAAARGREPYNGVTTRTGVLVSTVCVWGGTQTAAFVRYSSEHLKDPTYFTLEGPQLHGRGIRVISVVSKHSPMEAPCNNYSKHPHGILKRDPDNLPGIPSICVYIYIYIYTYIYIYIYAHVIPVSLCDFEQPLCCNGLRIPCLKKGV